MPQAFPRRGAWAILDTRVGIIFQHPQIDVSADDLGNRIETPDPSSAEVHFVDELGETTECVRGVPVVSLAQARYEDIPVPRRPEPAIAEQLGYLVGGA